MADRVPEKGIMKAERNKEGEKDARVVDGCDNSAHLVLGVCVSWMRTMSYDTRRTRDGKVHAGWTCRLTEDGVMSMRMRMKMRNELDGKIGVAY